MTELQTRKETPLDRRQLLGALRAFRRGEFGVRLPDDVAGVDGQICEAFNEVVQFADSLRTEVVQLQEAVGREGRTHRRIGKSALRGAWADYVTGVNGLLDDVTEHTTDVARVLTAVAKGDLSQTIDL
jgi:hypothetical protein